jgi:ketosteroid isomerase-like protein
MTNNDTATTPDVITRYLGAADTKDATALADCFAADGTVVDEGVTYTGRAEIRAWREQLAGQFTYTSVVTGSTPVSAEEHRVTAHIEGDFPGGQADLTYTFVVREGLIAALHIG